jgi:hypothetical protein
MKKQLITLLFCGVSAFATPVTYSTSATLSGPDLSGSSLANGGATITFTDQASTGVNAPTNISLGFFTVSGGTGTFSGDSILLTITQTVPSSGSASSSSTISGAVTSTSNGIDVTFSPTTVHIGSATYNLLANYFLVAPNTNGGVTSVEANVAVPTTAPEPASLALIGSSLIGIGAVLRRRIAK